MRAYILAGGLGTRLRPYTFTTPKCLLKVCNRPIIEWQIDFLRYMGFSEIVVLIREEYYDTVEYLTKRPFVKVVNVGASRGTAETLRRGLRKAGPRHNFVVLNGDIITDIDPLPLLEALVKQGCVGAIATVTARLPYGVVKGSGGWVTKFVEKPPLPTAMINAGVYAFRPEIKEWLKGAKSLEHDVFPKLARKRKLAFRRYGKALWIAVDTHKDLEEAQKRCGEIYAAIGKLMRRAAITGRLPTT